MPMGRLSLPNLAPSFLVVLCSMHNQGLSLLNMNSLEIDLWKLLLQFCFSWYRLWFAD